MENESTKIVVPGDTTSKKTMDKFLTDPKITPELKMLCFRLATNPILERLIEKTPINAIFWVCEEYKKNPNLYDEIFCGNVKLRFNESEEDLSPVFNPQKTSSNTNLSMFFGSNTLIGEVVETFTECSVENEKIARISIKIKDKRIYTAGFNSSDKMVSLTISQANKGYKEKGIIENFLHMTKGNRLDIIRH